MKNKSVIKVDLTIYCNSILNSLEITSLLELSPTKDWSKGDIIRKNFVVNESAWIYSTGNVESLCAEDVVSIILDKLKGKETQFSQYLRANNLNIKFDIIIKAHSNCFPSLYYSKEFIKTCYLLDADIETDVYIG